MERIPRIKLNTRLSGGVEMNNMSNILSIIIGTILIFVGVTSIVGSFYFNSLYSLGVGNIFDAFLLTCMIVSGIMLIFEGVRISLMEDKE